MNSPPESCDSKACMRLAAAKRASGKQEEALSLYEKAFVLTPRDAVAREYHLAVTKLGQFPRAEPVFHDARLLRPQSRTIRYLLIDVLLRQGKFEKALTEIKGAMVLFGTDEGMLAAALYVRDRIGPKDIANLQNRKDSVSLCMIVKNEASLLAKCLLSVDAIVDEMIVVDTGSSDSTKEIAKVFGAKVYDFKWCDDFSKARNFSLSKASGDWVFVVDADEVISSVDHAAFRELVEKPFSSPVAYSIETRNYTMLANTVGWFANDGTYEAEEAGIGWTSSVKVRLFPNRLGIRFTYPIHELVDPLLSDCDVSKQEGGIPVHHYGKLDEEKRAKKGEAYYHIGAKKLDELGDNLFALRELAIQAGELERHEEAIELWQRVISLQPDMPEAFVNKGSAYWQTGHYEDALVCAKRAILLSSDLKEAHFNCAVSLLLLGRAKEAVSVLENLILHVPEYLAAQFILASSCCCIGKKEQGLKHFSTLKETKLGPALGAAFTDLAKRFISAQRTEYAILLLEAAMEGNNHNSETLRLLNECRRESEDRSQRTEIKKNQR